MFISDKRYYTTFEQLGLEVVYVVPPSAAMDGGAHDYAHGCYTV